MRDLISLGWGDFFEQGYQAFLRSQSGSQVYLPGRVLIEQRGAYKLYTEVGEVTASTTGKLKFEASSPAALPAIGDWVVISANEDKARAQIHCVLARRSKFSRKAAGSNTQEQVVAANVDTVFLVQGLDRDYNLRRIERYLVAAYESGAAPVVVLTKLDLCEDSAARVTEVESIAPGVAVHALSGLTRQGLEQLDQYVMPGSTVAFLGSSGAGKSTLINRIIGEEVQKTAAVREHDGRGKHTTTHRELIVLESGGLLIDTPGMRELQLWDAGGSLGEAFADVESIAASCYFTDCHHQSEPGCAVREALADGSLDASRYENYTKMEKELDYLDSRMDEKVNLRRKEREKKLHRAYRMIKNNRKVF